MRKLSLILIVVIISGLSLWAENAIFYDFTVLDIDGNEVSLSQFKDKPIMIVNVASKCGYTYQYEGLEELYERYSDKGFVILGFPANDFLWQESGTNEEIKAFCTLTYGVTFPMFSKVKVTGRNKVPLYDYLTSEETNPRFGGRITWNFNKFLIDRNGTIVDRFDSKTEPLSDEIISAVESLL